MYSTLPGVEFVKGTSSNKLVYKIKNMYAEDERYLHFIWYQPHIMKTGRNNASHSDFACGSRIL